MTPSKDELIATVQQYYDSSNAFLFTTKPSPETVRRQALWTQWTADLSTWKSFKSESRNALPSYHFGETFPSDDGGPRCIVYPPEELRSPTSNWAIVGCISLLAPVYFVYGVQYDYTHGRAHNFRESFEQPPPSMSFPAQVVARTIEKAFNIRALPKEILKIPVQLYAGLLEPPQTTLFHTLFTNDPGNIP